MKAFLIISQPTAPTPVLIAAGTLHMHAAFKAESHESTVRTCLCGVHFNEVTKSGVNCTITIDLRVPWISTFETHLFVALIASSRYYFRNLLIDTGKSGDGRTWDNPFTTRIRTEFFIRV